MDNEPWDGLTERRRSQIAAHNLYRETIQVSAGVVIVGTAAILLLLCAVLIGQAFLSGDHKEENRESEEFRRQISCVLVGGAQGKNGTDLLTQCGFIRLGVD